MTRFSAPWSLSLRLTTAATLTLFLLLPAPLLSMGGAFPLVYLAVLVVVLLVARASVILGYRVSSEGIVVRRLGADIRFDLAELRTLKIDPKAMIGTYVMPNGGLFSFGGRRCRNRRLGRYEAYATDKKLSVILGLERGIAVLTPDDPRGFVHAVRAAGWKAERR